MTNDEPQPVAALFPKTMAALEACSVPLGVRLVAFGKQLPHTALHWHSDGRNYMLTAHIPLAGPTVCGDGALANPDPNPNPNPNPDPNPNPNPNPSPSPNPPTLTR